MVMESTAIQQKKCRPRWTIAHMGSLSGTLESISRSLQLASTRPVGMLARETVRWKIAEIATIRCLVSIMYVWAWEGCF
jgi:hypothetical protein